LNFGLDSKTFADDINVFASAGDLKPLEDLMNSELAKVKKWCDTNKLSINMGKTNLMIIKFYIFNLIVHLQYGLAKPKSRAPGLVVHS